MPREGVTYDKPKKKPPVFPKGHCGYCGKKLEGNQRKWCSSHHGYLFWLEYKEKPIYWSQWRGKILRRDNFKCRECGRSYRDLSSTDDPNDTLHVHHVVPIKDGGAEFDEDNCITLCTECHKKKHAAHPTSAHRISKDQLTLGDFFSNFKKHVFGDD